MKKIISLGIASAVLAMTALSANATIVASSEATHVLEAQMIDVTFKTDAVIPRGAGFTFELDYTGVTLEKVEINEAYANYTASQEKVTVVAIMGDIPLDTTLVTCTFTVTAQEGETISFDIKNPQVKNMTYSGSTSWSTTIYPAEDVSDPSESEESSSSESSSSESSSSETSSSESSSSESSSSESSSSESSSSESSSSESSSSESTPSESESTSSESESSSTSEPDPEKPPQTGIALAVFPAVIAGAAVVVAKKRK